MFYRSFICLKFIFIVFVMDLTTSTKRSFHVVWINTTCFDNSEYAIASSVLSKFEDRAVINFQVKFVKDINEMETRLCVDIMRKKSEDLRMVDVIADGCKFLEDGGKLNIIIILHRMVEQFGTFPKKCPLLADHNYTLTNYYLDAENLPTFTPEGVFRTTIEVRTNGIVIVRVITYGKVVPKKSRIQPF